MVVLTSGFVLLAPRASVKIASLPVSPTERVPRVLILLVFAVGFLGLATETVWLRVFGFYWESGTFCYALVTAGQIGGLFLGSFAASRFVRRMRSNRKGVAIGLGLSATCLAIAAALEPFAVQVYFPFSRIALVFLLVGIPAACFGAAFVFILDCVRGTYSAAKAIGILSGSNSAGAAAGPVILWVIAPWISWPTQLLAIFSCVFASLILIIVPSRSWQMVKAALLLVGLGFFNFLYVPQAPPPEAYIPGAATSSPPNFGARVVTFIDSGLMSTIAVTRDTATGAEILWIDRSFQGDTSPLGRKIPKILGTLPCDLLNRTPRRVMVIGLGTGLTLAGVLERGPTTVEVVELCLGVIEANHTILASVNGDVLKREEVSVFYGDGRTLLADAGDSFDLIVTDMVFPTALGAGNIFSREFYDLARRRLSDDGLFVHWIPCFQLSPDDFSSVCAAFLSVFPEGTAWIGFMGPNRFILGLAGGAVSERLPQGVAGRLALGPAQLSGLAKGATPIRDGDPRLEYRSSPYWNEEPFGEINLGRVLVAMRSMPTDGHQGKVRMAWLNFAEGRLAELRSAPGNAISHYKKASEVAPDVTDAETFLETLRYRQHMEAARMASVRGDRDTMIRKLQDASLHPYQVEANLRLAEVISLSPQRDPAKVMAELEKVIAKRPRSADAYLRMALVARSHNDLERAREAFRAACSLRPDRPPIYQELARDLGTGP